MPARCFLIEPLKKHVDTERLLQQYGDIVYLFKNDESRPSVFDDRFADECAERLDDLMFNTANDYLVIGGSANAIAKVIALLVDEFDGSAGIHSLMFSPEEQRYISVMIG